VVVAGLYAVEHSARNRHAEWFTGQLLHLDVDQHPATIEPQRHMGLVDLMVPFDDVADRPVVDEGNDVAHPHIGRGSG